MNESIVFKQDARSVKTRKAIKSALVRLLKRKTVSEVGVIELMDLAHRNRNSFYTHYKCVDDVLTDVTYDVIHYVNKVIRKFTFKQFLIEPRPLLKEIGNFICLHKRTATLYMTLTCSNDIRNEMKRKFSDQIAECSKHQFGISAKIVNYAISFFVSGAIDSYCNWLLNGDISMFELTEALIGFVNNGFKNVKICLGCEKI